MTPAEKFAKFTKKKPRKAAPGARGAGKLPNRLRDLREALGLSLRDVERASGVNNVTVYNAESGCEVSLSAALKLAQFYGHSIENIWK